MIGTRPTFMDNYPFLARAPTDSPRPSKEVDDECGPSGSWVPVRGIREWGFRTAEERDHFVKFYKEAREC